MKELRPIFSARRASPLISQKQGIASLAMICATVLNAFGALSPLRVSSDNRHLEDAQGRPFFLVGEAPQNLPLYLALPEMDGYMADCEVKGFNLLWICIDGQRSVSKTTIPPIDRNNNLMMTNGWDIGTLNDTYFVTIDAVVNAADRHNIYCMFTPLSECEWMPTNIMHNTSNHWYAYGRFLGDRYKDKANIVWQFGNDTMNTDAQHPIVQGIKDAGDQHLMTVNWTAGKGKCGSGWTRKHDHGESWIDLDAWYQGDDTACYWQKIEYEHSDPMPTFQTEAHYQKPDPADAPDLYCRMEDYYVALGGGCGGQVYGSGMLADKFDYETYKNSGGRVQTLHFKKLFTSRDWTTLIPDYTHTFVTAGYGQLTTNTIDYVGAAINNAGTLGMAYCPKETTITADLARFSGPVTARWYDPTDGTYKGIGQTPLPNTGRVSLTTPGKNSEGDSDWILVLETRATKP